MVTYKTRDQTITPADLNGLFAAFEAKLSTLLNGKTFIIAFPDRGSAQVVPPQLLGKCFFFNNGKPTAWSQEVPGAITYQVNVTDPVTGATVTGTGVRSYDHSYFSNAAAGAAVSYDLDNFIRRIADVPQSAYPPGLQKQNGISI